MKKLLKISLLLCLLCLTVPVFAEGDLTTGNKTCTQNCGNFYDDSIVGTTISDDSQSEQTSAGEIYSWIFGQIFRLVN